jgi:hypothetical protein
MVAKLNKDRTIPTDPAPRVTPENNGGDYYTTYMARMEKLLQQQPTVPTPYYKKEDVLSLLASLARNYSPSPDDPEINLHAEVSVGSLLFDICSLLSMDAEEICSIIGVDMYEELTESSFKLMTPTSIKNYLNSRGQNCDKTQRHKPERR